MGCHMVIGSSGDTDARARTVLPATRALRAMPDSNRTNSPLAATQPDTIVFHPVRGPALPMCRNFEAADPQGANTGRDICNTAVWHPDEWQDGHAYP